ncbi:hypothetical protein BC332_19204 [Capsicum chinense]|nr:hypothetical protein BC332_19204 [Capsicum chinense]
MLEDGVQSSRYAYTALISGLGKGCVYLDRMKDKSFMPNTVLYTSLIKQFLRKREFEFAFKLIDLMERSEIEWDLICHDMLANKYVPCRYNLKWKMTTDSQVHDTAMTVAATNVATTSRTNASPAMAPAEKLDKFAGIDFKRWYGSEQGVSSRNNNREVTTFVKGLQELLEI